MAKVNLNVKLLTQEGYEKIKSELNYRETELRDSLAETLNEMRNQGDLRENDGYSMACEQNEQNEEEILRLKEVLKNSKVVKKHSKTKVDIGSNVTVLCDKNERTYTIVGEDNANPLEGKISYKSPIGAALMGTKVGEEIELTTPRGNTKYTVKSIS
jgi:transcription elongation factor GreA